MAVPGKMAQGGRFRLLCRGATGSISPPLIPVDRNWKKISDKNQARGRMDVAGVFENIHKAAFSGHAVSPFRAARFWRIGRSHGTLEIRLQISPNSLSGASTRGGLGPPGRRVGTTKTQLEQDRIMVWSSGCERTAIFFFCRSTGQQ